EVLGPDFLELDKVTHNNIDPDSIRKQLAALSKEDRAMFEGYAAGFTQRVREVKAQRDTLMPKEFLDKGFEPS
ncbi:penicillin acylase family protein, partial [Escherichia coli]